MVKCRLGRDDPTILETESKQDVKKEEVNKILLTCQIDNQYQIYNFSRKVLVETVLETTVVQVSSLCVSGATPADFADGLDLGFLEQPSQFSLEKS